MGKFVLVVSLITLLAARTSASTAKFSRDSRKFGFKLYKTLSGDTTENTVISPVSIQTALAFLYAGAAGTTATELAEGVHFDANENIVAENHKALLDHHARSGAVKIANKIYLEETFQVLPQFAEIGSSNFHSEVETIDTSDGIHAAQIVNSWVERKTNNKIKDLVSADDVINASSVIVSAVHFKADWVSPFKKDATFPRPFWISQFEKKNVDMMNQMDYFYFAEFNDFAILQLEYESTDISFVAILPTERDGLQDMESRLAEDNVDISDLLWYLKLEMVVLELPKFKIEFLAQLKPTLTKMGMPTMFSDLADFSKVSSEGLKLESVIHKALIEIDEKGTDAAVATEIRIAPQSLLLEPVPLKFFIADHPFLYLLLDSNGQIFFMGRYIG